MLASKKTRRGVIGAVVLAGVLAVSGYALTNVLGFQTTTNVGQGQLDTQTVTESGATYTLNASNPSNVDAVTFNLDKAIATTGHVWAQVTKTTDTYATGSTTTATKGQWFSCSTPTATAAQAFTCDLTAGGTVVQNAADITQLRVVAAD